MTNSASSADSNLEHPLDLHKVADLSPNLIYVIDLSQQKVVYVNNRVEILLGRKREDVYREGSNIFKSVMHPGDHDRRLQNLEKCKQLDDHEETRVEVRLKTRNKDFEWFRITDKVFKRTREGEVLQVIGTAENIHEEKIWKEKLREQEIRYRSLAENSPDFISRWNRELKLVFANKAFKEAMAHKGTVVNGTSSTKGPGTKPAPPQDKLQQVFKTGEVQVHFSVFSKPEGEIQMFNTLVPETGAEGEVESVLVIARDITQLKEAGKEIKKKQDLLEATMKSSTAMTQVFSAVRNAEGEIVDFKWKYNNQSSEDIYGDVIGKNLLEQNPGVVKEGIFDTFKRVVETGVSDISERHYVHEQFDGWFSQTAVKLGDGLVTTTIDITPIKEAQQKLLQSKTLLQDVIDSPNIGMAVYKANRNEQGEIVDFVHEYINRASLRMLGGEDFTGRPFTAHGQNAVVQLPQFIEVIQSQKRNSYVREADFRGKRVWFAITNTPLDNDRLVHTWEDVTEHKRAEQEILQLKEEIAQKATDKYRTLFETIDEGFNVLEYITGESGHPDFKIVETNEAWEQQTGLTDAPGKTLLEIAPNFEQHLLDFYIGVLKSGKGARTEYYTEATGHWYTVYASRIGGEGSQQLAVVFNDITDRRRQEKHQEFLLKFSDTLRPLSDEQSIEETALQMLAEFLELDRAYIFVLYPVGDRAVVRAEYPIKSLTSILGEVRMSDFPETVRQIEDETIVFNDIDNDARLSELNRTSLHAVNLQAFICASVRKDEKHVIWSLAAATVTPRVWAKDEVELIEIVTERIWSAVERAKAQEVIRASQKRFQSIANLVPDLLWESEPDGSTTWYNQRWLEYTGQSMEQAIGWGWTEVIHPDDREFSAQRYREAIRANKPVRQEHRIKSRDGEYRWFVISALPYRDEEGQVAKVYGAATEIHDRKQVEEALRKSQERLQKALSIDTVGVLFFDLEMQFHDANDTFLNMIGYTREEMERGMLKSEDVTLPEHMPRTRKAIQELKENGRFSPYEKELIRPDGTRWWGLFAGMSLNDKECVEFIVDITATKQAEEALLYAKNKAEKAATAKEDFLSTMSHEIRTPLNAVIGLTNLLLNGNPKERQKGHLKSQLFGKKSISSY